MEVEKRGVKGGFFQLFDWNGRSRKKLFSSKSELPEGLNQGKESYGSSGIARQLDLEKGFPSNARGHNDYYDASSANGDSEYGTKAPGVVARLMGLDSLPTLHVNEAFFSPPVEPDYCGDSSYLMAAPTLQREHDIVIFESVRNKLDGLSRNPLDLKLQRAQNRPIERFQKEVLPPKSAKPASISHHRPLSPIKSPGFIPPKNAAYIIEAASKMIEQSPRSNTKAYYSRFGSSSSVPLKIRDLKEKMEAAQRSSHLAEASSQRGKEQNSVRNVKKQLNARGQIQSENSYSRKGTEESKRVGSHRLKSKEKSGSFAAPAKTNTPKRERSNSVGNRSSEILKGQNDVKSSCGARNVTNSQKRLDKQAPSRKPSEVLKMNNQKQNCAITEDVDTLHFFDSNERKEPSASTIQGQTNRTVNKIVVNNVVTSKKTNYVAADSGKEFPSSKLKITSKRKVLINGNVQSSGSATPKSGMTKDEKSVKHNATFEGDSKWDGVDKKSSLDVVSFTFSSPIKKSGAGSNSCSTILEAANAPFLNFDPFLSESSMVNSAMTSSGFNASGGDALSVLLEQKLKELASRVELSKELSDAGSSGSVSGYGNVSSSNSLRSLHMDGDLCKSRNEIQNATDCSPNDRLWLKGEKESKGLNYIKGDGDNCIDYQRLHLQGSLSVSCQPSLSGASYDSFDADRRSCNEDRLLESYEVTNRSSTQVSHSLEGDIEISDTASSQSVGTVSGTVTSSSCIMDSKDPSSWELHYIEDILNNADLLWEKFALGEAHRIIVPSLFDQLENQKSVEDSLALERKVLFDCVCECLEARCLQFLTGNYKSWAKQTTMLHRSQWVAEDLYKEISSWTNADELMVDELVDKDMSLKNGKWVEFEVEASEEGVEMEERILTCLVDELIDDCLC